MPKHSKKKTLLPQPGKENSLSKYGYNLRKSSPIRHKSLRSASKKYKPLPVLRKLNLIRNLSRSRKDNYKKLSSDVEYMKKLNKRLNNKKGSKKKSRKTSKKR